MINKKNHICYLADAASPHTIKLANHFQNAGYMVSVVSFNLGTSKNIETHYIGLGLLSNSKIKYIVGLPKLKKQIESINPDILHAIYATSYGFAGACLGFHPYIVSAVGSDVALRPQDSFILKQTVRYAIHKADAIHSQSQHLTDKMVLLGADRRKISTFTFGINDNITNAPFSARDFSGPGRTVISTRAFEPVYNIELLVRAIPLVLKKIPDTKFLIAGRGSLEGKLRKEIIKLNISHATEFVGFLPSEKMAQVLGKADVYVSTSLSDGQSISLLEGMASGAFPIVTNIEANKSWVRDGQNGYLCPVSDPSYLAEKIVDALLNPKLRKAAYEENREMVKEKGSFKKNMSILESQYRRLIKRG